MRPITRYEVGTSLSSEGTAGSRNGSQSYEDIDYAIRLEAGGTVSVYEAGVYKGDFGTFMSVYPLQIDTSLYGLNSQVNNVCKWREQSWCRW